METREKTPRGGYAWKFRRVGGVDQVVIRNGEDIAHIPELDQKLWVALAMPKKIAGIQAKTLDALDTDGDGRIRAPEILAAIAYLNERLADLSELGAPGESLRVASIRETALRETALWVLSLAGKPGAGELSLSDVSAASGIFGSQRFNGDGVLPPESLRDDAASQLLAKDILKCLPGAADSSGSRGLDLATIEAFRSQATAYVAWMDARIENPRLGTLGIPQIEAIVSASETVRAKIEDWFLRCQLALLSGEARTPALGQVKEADLDRLLSGAISLGDPDLLSLPLARIDPRGALPLDGPFNPGWTLAMAAFRASALPALAGAGAVAEFLDAALWEKVKAAIDPLRAWIAAKPEGSIDTIGLERARGILEGDSLAKLESLVAEDAAWSARRHSLTELEILLLFRKDLPRILANFVSFSDFYDRKSDAVFQAGTLYIDGRACALCLEVDDPARHSPLAAMSSIYLAYCSCSRPDGMKKTIVAAFTAGDGRGLFVGRNGIFYDREGADWDATVTKLLPQPISVPEAFWSPYRWLGRTFEELVGKRAQSAEASSQARLKGVSESVVAGVADGKKIEAPRKIEVGTVAAIGVALGSVGAMVTGILGSLLGLGIWMPAGILAALLMISGPSMLLAYFKLRRRNLGPALDASGWAINGRLAINAQFGKKLTCTANLPANAERSLVDPYAAKKRPWKLILALAFLLALALVWLAGGFDRILPPAWWFSTLLGV